MLWKWSLINERNEHIMGFFGVGSLLYSKLVLGDLYDGTCGQWIRMFGWGKPPNLYV